MSSNEDYLNSLLNSVMEESGQDENPQGEVSDGNEDFAADLLNALSGNEGVSELSDLLEQTDAESLLDEGMLGLLENTEAENVSADDVLSDDIGINDAIGTDDALFDFFANEQEERMVPESEQQPDDIMAEESLDGGFDFLQQEDEVQVNFVNEEVDQEGEQELDFVNFFDDQMEEPAGELTEEASEQDFGQLFEQSTEQSQASELDELLGPVESPAEKKERIKREKQEAKEKAKAEKIKAKEEKARAKAERAKAKGNEKKKKGHQEKETQSDANAASELGLDFGMDSANDIGDFGSDIGDFGNDNAGDLGSDINLDMLADLGFSSEGQSDSDLESQFDAMLQPEKKGKKKGFFSKLSSALFDEVEEDEKEPIEISDENREILEEIGNEEIGNKKGLKKDKKGKKGKKDKKKKGAVNPDAEGDEQEETDNNKKKGKKQKKKKEKEKKPVEKGPKEKGKKLPRKSIIVICAFCLTILAIVVVCSMILPKYWDHKNARKAYYKGDYETVYELLNGEKLNESDQMLFNRSELVLMMENKLDAYRIHIGLEEEFEAVNDLFAVVAFYHDNYTYAQELDALDEIQNSYNEALSLLENNYGVFENQAVEIVQMSRLEYNRELYYLINGIDFTIPEMGDSVREHVEPVIPDDREDKLPEEEAIPQPEETGTMDFGNETETDVHAESDYTNDDAIDGINDATIDDVNEETIDDANVSVDEQDNPDLLYSGEVENGSVVVQ